MLNMATERSQLSPTRPPDGACSIDKGVQDTIIIMMIIMIMIMIMINNNNDKWDVWGRQLCPLYSDALSCILDCRYIYKFIL